MAIFSGRPAEMKRRLLGLMVGILMLFASPSSANQLRGATSEIALQNAASSSSSGGSIVGKKKIVIVSDVAIELSGINTALTNTKRELELEGHQVLYLTPTTLDLPTVRLYGIDSEFIWGMPWLHTARIFNTIKEFEPDHIHIATEALVGSVVRAFCLEQGWRFSTSFHTNSAEYMLAKVNMPLWVSWYFLRLFHSKASSVMAPTETMVDMLKEEGFNPKALKVWSRGVDREVFHPREADPVAFPKTNGPIFMYVGRISEEKNIEEFLEMPLPGTKYVVGKGTNLPSLQRNYPDAVYLGYLAGDDLAAAYSNADVVVFPSKTDTFGNTITEAMASGTPVAGFMAPGPVDIIKPNPKIGAVNEDIGLAIAEAYLNGDPEECVNHVANKYTWEIATQQFLDNLVPIQCDDEGGCRESSNTLYGTLYESTLLSIYITYLLRKPLLLLLACFLAKKFLVKRLKFFAMMRHNFVPLHLLLKMNPQEKKVDKLMLPDFVDDDSEDSDYSDESETTHQAVPNSKGRWSSHLSRRQPRSLPPKIL